MRNPTDPLASHSRHGGLRPDHGPGPHDRMPTAPVDTVPLLRLAGVSRVWEQGSVRALDEVSFVARAGETIALTGPSGCGKSTLLSLIGLLDQPDVGHIVLAGQDLRQVRRPADFRARHLGFVFQFHHMVPTMTLLENVMAPMLATGVPRAERVRRAATMLDQMGLADRAGFLPSRVSGGERQRAAVARALVNRPPVVLADEPTGNLDSRNGDTVVQLLLDHAREQGALVLLATHNPEIAAACSRRLALRDGRLVGDSAWAQGATRQPDGGEGHEGRDGPDRPHRPALKVCA